MKWKKLQPLGHYSPDRNLASLDPCLLWAEVTGFAHHSRSGDAPSTVPVIVELAAGRNAAQLQSLLGKLDHSRVRPTYLSATSRYCVADFSAKACRKAFSGALKRVIARFEFAGATLPQRPFRRGSSVKAAGASNPARTTQADGAEVLYGVIDFGCPFASSQFRNGLSTRLLNIWDQDTFPAFGAPPTQGGVPSDFGYGREVDRVMIDALLAACVVPGSGTVDEDVCYERASYPELRQRATHGAHVLDQLVGPNRRPGRMQEYADSPAPKPPGEPLEDIVFVQLPRDAWADPGGNALAACVLDGLRYIVSCAGRDTQHIVVNISCAIHTGPHNGSSILERAMDELVSEQKTSNRRLSIFVPTGNSYDARLHAEGHIPPNQLNRVLLRVPPDNEFPTVLEVWMATTGALPEVRVRPPGRASLSSRWLKPGQARLLAGSAGTLATVVHTSSQARGCAGLGLPSEAHHSMMMFFVEPTHTPDRPGLNAPSGDWSIEVRAHSATNVQIHVGRCENELGAPLRAHAARLVDSEYDPMRFLQAASDDPYPPSPLQPGQLIPAQRRNSISGMATGSAINAVSGYVLRSNRSAAAYSSAGQNPSSSLPRPNPALSAVSNESSALPGLLGAGTRSACVVRLVGTSFASPRAARLALVSSHPKPTTDIGRLGKGALDP